jgi:hypothetical protein
MELSKQSLALSVKYLKMVLSGSGEPDGSSGSAGRDEGGAGGNIRGSAGGDEGGVGRDEGSVGRDEGGVGRDEGGAGDNIGGNAARDRLMRTSVLSAMAFSQTRTTACHSISYPLTNLFGIEHGLAAAMTLGEVYKINKPAMSNAGEIDEIFSDFGGIQGFLDSACDGIIKLRLGAFGAAIDDIPNIVSKAFTAGRMDNNPVDLSESDVAGILKNVL